VEFGSVEPESCIFKWLHIINLLNLGITTPSSRNLTTSLDISIMMLKGLSH